MFQSLCGTKSILAISIIFTQLIDDGVANILGLQTLRHGTNFVNYIGIRILGGDPSHGGKSSGSSCPVKHRDLENTRGRFYLFKDSDMAVGKYQGLNIIERCIDRPFIAKRFLPRLHASLSGYGLGSKSIEEISCHLKPVKIFAGISSLLINVVAVPTLRFRYSKIDSHIFEDDMAYGSKAYKTKYKVEAWRIGLFGSIVTGFNSEWCYRAKKNPKKILTGIAQLAFGIGLTILYAKDIRDNSTLFILGALIS
jgi:hypothetical protein